MSDTGAVMAPCPCARCTTPRVENGIVVNNLHGKLRPCERCGRPKTEYVDAGARGCYACWWCRDRAAGGERL